MWSNTKCVDKVFSDVQCPSGFTCTRLHEWFWHCGALGYTPGSVAGSSSKEYATVFSLWQQCGGTGDTCDRYKCVDTTWPGTSCGEGLHCNRLNQFFWQCQAWQGGDWGNAKAAPGGYGGSSKEGAKGEGGYGGGYGGGKDGGAGDSRDGSSRGHTDGKEIAEWQQCGGTGYSCDWHSCVDGPWTDTWCESGLRCVRLHQWYWQCHKA
jgi:hypothetical protein